jgi:hypothetical protein
MTQNTSPQFYVPVRVEEAYDWLDNEGGRQEVRKHRAECILVSGRQIVGYGNSWKEAREMARSSGINLDETASVYNEQVMPDLSPMF